MHTSLARQQSRYRDCLAEAVIVLANNNEKLLASLAHGGDLRIAYLSGPVDGVDVFQNWSERRGQSYFGTSYLSQFFDVCTEFNAQGYVVTIHDGPKYIKQCGKFLIENIPLVTRKRWLAYHLGMLFWYILWLPKLLKFRPDILIATANQQYWFCLFFLRWFGIRIVPSVHCTFLPRYQHKNRHWKFLNFLNRHLFWRQIREAMAVSETVALEIRSQMSYPVNTFLPTYSPHQFSQIKEPVRSRPFRVFFAGRIERNKGIYDLIDIARRFCTEMPGEFQFDVCGEGSESSIVRNLPLPNNLTLHGKCAPSKLLSILGQSHVVVVPTRTTFEEGFNKVCAEAILAGRPVVTSDVCPALAAVREAAVEVTPDATEEYYDAILRLSNDNKFYEAKRSACSALESKFYDPKNSWSAHLKIILKHANPN